MKHILKTLSILCALMILATCTVSFADSERPASPTDLEPVITETEESPEGQPEANPEETGNPAAEDEPEAPEIPDAQEPAAEEPAEATEAPDAQEPAAEEPAESPETPDVQEPAAEEPAEDSEGEGNAAEEDSAGGIEIVIAGTLRTGESWNGIIRRKVPTVLRLDLREAQTSHILIEGRDIRAGIRRTDQSDEDSPQRESDPETNRIIIDLDAANGSFLLSLEPGEDSLMAKVSVSILDQEAYEAWLTENSTEAEDEDGTAPGAADGTEPEQEEEAGNEPEQEEEAGNEPQAQEDEQEEEAGNEPQAQEDEQEEENVTPAERSIKVGVTWDTPEPVIGDTAHFSAILEGYENLNVSLQWQYSADRKTWIDLPGETNEIMDVVVTEENNFVFWRIVVYVEETPED